MRSRLSGEARGGTIARDDDLNDGVAFTPFETRADTILRCARQAEALNLDRVQVAEAWSHDATILLAEIAKQTSRIGLGSGVLSVWSRSPASIALAAAGLQRASGGRFSLGLGAGSPPLTEGLHGLRWERPMTRVRETLIEVRALLAGDRSPATGAGRAAAAARRAPRGAGPDRARGARGGVDPAGRGVGGRMGAVPVGALAAGGGARAARRGRVARRVPQPTRIVVAVPVALGPDVETARRLAAWWLSTYATRMGPDLPADARALLQR